jgi:2-oxoglutarate ferredoxin oxidoreductase subunit beta
VPHAVRRNIDITYLVMDNQIYGLTKGQLSPTSSKGRRTVTSAYGSLENPVNPLLYVLAYGAPFVAQGTPANIPELADLIEQAIRFPGFAFVNMQSPCVTYGEAEQQIKIQKTIMQSLASLGHDTSDMTQALVRAQSYGHELITGVYYRAPEPPPLYSSLIQERQQELMAAALSRTRVLDRFLQRQGG